MTTDTHVTPQMLADRFIRSLSRMQREMLARNLRYTMIASDGMGFLRDALEVNPPAPVRAVAATDLADDDLYDVQGRVIRFVTADAITALIAELTALERDVRG